MKHIFTKLSAIAFMALLSGNVMATDYYISGDTGIASDANDGLSAEKPFATLKYAVGKMQNGDVLYVSGFIKMDAQYEIRAKQVTVQGSNPQNDGFDGQGKCAILKLYQANCTLTNLTFKDGYFQQFTTTDTRVATGSAITIYSSIANIDNCVFVNNKTVDENIYQNHTGGALFVNGMGTSAIVTAASLNIKNSQFKNNTSGANGGAATIFEVPTTIENCVFDGNEADGNGGALNFSMPRSYSIKQCVFVNNKAVSTASNQVGSASAVNLFLRKAANQTPTFTGPYDMECSTFYNNSSTRYGVFNVNVGDIETDGVTIANRTLNFVNCTVSGNTTASANNGAISISGTNADLNFVNTILESNTATGSDNYKDLWLNSVNTSRATVKFISSVIGSINGSIEGMTQTNCCLNKTTNASAAKYAGLASFQDNYFPLYQASLATNLGTSENRPEKDQLGNAWTGKYIGAVQKVVEPEDGAMYVASLNDDGTTNEVTICRKLVGNEWNTICLPFNLNNKQKDDPNQEEYDKYFGENAKVACIYNQTVENGVIVFTDRSNKVKGDLVAGRPNLVMPTEDRTVIITKAPTATSPSFSSVKDAAGNEYKFIGVFNPTEIKTTDVCLGRGGVFFHPSEGKTSLPGLRGYFQFPANVTPSSAKVFISGVSDTTDIIDLKANGTAKDAKIYTLGGQYMGTDAQSLPKGIYVIGNKKVVIK